MEAVERLFRKPIRIKVSDYEMYAAHGGSIKEEVRYLLASEVSKKCPACVSCSRLEWSEMSNPMDFSTHYAIGCNQRSERVRCGDGFIGFRDSDGDLAQEVVMIDEPISTKMADPLMMDSPVMAKRKIVKVKDLPNGVGAIARGLDLLKPGMSTDDGSYKSAVMMDTFSKEQAQRAKAQKEGAERLRKEAERQKLMRDIPQTAMGEAW